MRLLQDWSTLPGNGTTPFVQSSSGWLDLSGFGDVCFWLEVRSVAKPGAGEVVLTYETAPATDNSLFQPLASVTLAVSTSPVVTSIRLGANPAVPLARYVRWRLEGTAAGDWSTTLRIHVAPGPGTSAAGILNPASLALTGWWRGSYGGAPWLPTASAGTSGSYTLFGPTNAPSVGSAVNGLTPADFDGTNDRLACDNAVELGDLLSASAYSFVALVYVDSAPPNPVEPWDAPQFMIDGVGAWGVGCVTIAGVPKVIAWHTDNTQVADFSGASWGHGAWKLIQVKYDGSTIKGRVNSDA